jgi:hypothetical protein
MIERIKRLKHPDAVFSAFGILYLIFLGAITAILIQFLADSALLSLQTTRFGGVEPPTFAVQQAESIVKTIE